MSTSSGSLSTTYCTDTIYGMINQRYALLGGKVPYQYYPNTTLNKKYSCFIPQEVNGVWQNVPRDSAGNVITPPPIAYFGIGIRGFYNITSDDEISPLSQPYIPRSKEKDLYRPLPIRCVPKEYDLNATERAKYRLRTEVTINNSTYVCYWLKKLTFSSSLDLVQIDASGAETDYIIDDSTDDLNPTPTAPTTPTVISGSSKIVIAAQVTCEITKDEIMEAINVLYGGDTRRARISEWGLYTGGDQVVTNSEGLTYTEALYTQLSSKRCTTGLDMSDQETQQETITIQNGNLLLVD